VIETEPEPIKQIEETKEPEPMEEENEVDPLTEIYNKFERRPSESAKSGGLTPKSFNETEFDEFKLSRKHSNARKSGNGHVTTDISPTSKKMERTNSTPKKYEEALTQASSIGNKLIDQTVLKNLGNFFFDQTYKTLSERLSNHLKPEVANIILRDIKKTHNPN